MFGTSAYGPYWGALFSALLLVGCVTDIRVRRIPNYLVLVILATGFVFSVASSPVPAALLSSTGGVFLGFGIWIAFWVFGMLGAGDVKFFAAAGAWLGPQAVWRAALISAIFGGLLAVVMLLRNRQLQGGVERTALALSSRTLGVLDMTPGDEEARRKHLPYGVALAAGALVTGWLPKLIP